MSLGELENATPTTAIAQRVRHLRKRKDWSAARLGDALTEYGVPWDRFTVRGLESGKRQNVTIQEIYALAYVLDVAPVHLLIPLDNDTPLEVLPGRAEPAGLVREWLRGHAVLPGQNPRTYRAEVAEGELVGAYRPGERTSEQLARQRRIHELLASAGPQATDQEALEELKRLDPEAWEGDDAGH